GCGVLMPAPPHVPARACSRRLPSWLTALDQPHPGPPHTCVVLHWAGGPLGPAGGLAGGEAGTRLACGSPAKARACRRVDIGLWQHAGRSPMVRRVCRPPRLGGISWAIDLRCDLRYTLSLSILRLLGALSKGQDVSQCLLADP